MRITRELYFASSYKSFLYLHLPDSSKPWQQMEFFAEQLMSESLVEAEKRVRTRYNAEFVRFGCQKGDILWR